MNVLLLLAACSEPPYNDFDDTALAEVVDDTIDEADVTMPASGFSLAGPDFVVEPYQDVMYCNAGTYTGDDQGIVSVFSHQGKLGHHLQLLGTSLGTLDLPDGETFDCTSTSDLPMDDLEPIALPTGNNLNEFGVAIPDGFAVKIKTGQRWVLQSHYVNTTGDAIHVRDLSVIGTIPVEEVQTWAAPIVFNTVNVTIGAQSTADRSFDYTLEDDIHLLAVTGHMHEYGTAFSTEIVEGEQTTKLYDVPAWEGVYRDAPPMNSYGEGEKPLPAGTTIRTNCSWYNDTDEEIVWPHEMCVTYGLVYPALTAIVFSD